MPLLRAGITIVALVLFLSGGLAAAESAAPLTQENVQRFLQSMPDVEKLGEKYADGERGGTLDILAARNQMASTRGASNMAPPTKEQLEIAAAPLTASLAGMRASAGYDEMVATVKRHGFSSVEEWATIGDRSIRAYAALQMDAEAPNIEAQMKEMRENLAKSGMPAQQQEAMLKMMSSSAEVLNTFADVPAADKKAIAPFAAQFEQLGQSP
ncbi:MAG: hypothetical protein JRE71_19605 [Deltaproteobacteria bacterium]|nr:hypothetical protein [Deltaproteobacteria bacterium]